MLHLRINDLLPEHQSAYRSCHSAESALLKVTSDALLAADQGKLTYSGCSTWVPRSTALTISSSSGDWTFPSALMKMHSNGSSPTSQVEDNTYATTVGRLKYPWLNAAYLKARCSDRCISSFLQQMSSVSLTSKASPFMDMPMTCRSTTTVSSTTCTPHIQACRLHR